MFVAIQNRSLLCKMRVLVHATGSTIKPLHVVESQLLARYNPYKSFHKTTRVLSSSGPPPPLDYGYAISDERFQDNKPTLEYAKSMPNKFSAMRHEQILQLCVEGSFCGEY